MLRGKPGGEVLIRRVENFPAQVSEEILRPLRPACSGSARREDTVKDQVPDPLHKGANVVPVVTTLQFNETSLQIPAVKLLLQKIAELATPVRPEGGCQSRRVDCDRWPLRVGGDRSLGSLADRPIGCRDERRSADAG